MKSTYSLDGYERKILAELQDNGRISNAEISRRVGLSQTAVADRIRDMENAGVIQNYGVSINSAAVGLPITAFITMSCEGDRCKRLPADIADLREILEFHRLTGDSSALLKAVLPDIEALESLVDKLSVYGKPSTAIVLSSPYTQRSLPL